MVQTTVAARLWSKLSTSRGRCTALEIARDPAVSGFEYFAGDVPRRLSMEGVRFWSGGNCTEKLLWRPFVWHLNCCVAVHKSPLLLLAARLSGDRYIPA